MIDARRLTGPGAGVVKYDVLTALGIIGMQATDPGAVPTLRLIAAVTARYNWRQDEMVIGQRDLARLWGVSERTAKRETRRLTAGRLLLVRRPGVRGRVASYRLNFAEIARRSRPYWDSVGADFAERMAAHEPAEDNVVRVAFAAPEGETASPAVQCGTWRAVRSRLRSADPAAFANWYEHLGYAGRDGRVVRLTATTPFVGRYVETHLMRPLVAAIEAELGPFDRLSIDCR